MNMKKLRVDDMTKQSNLQYTYAVSPSHFIVINGNVDFENSFVNLELFDIDFDSMTNEELDNLDKLIKLESQSVCRFIFNSCNDNFTTLHRLIAEKIAEHSWSAKEELSEGYKYSKLFDKEDNANEKKIRKAVDKLAKQYFVAE